MFTGGHTSSASQVSVYVRNIKKCMGQYQSLTNRARGPYRGILARARGSTDRAQQGPYQTIDGQYSPVRLKLARLVSTTSLKTNSMNINHAEYKQGFKNDF